MTQRQTATLTGTAAALGTVSTSRADRAIIVISGLSAETITVTGNVAGSIYTAALRPFNLLTGALEASDSLLSNGEFLFTDLAYDNLKFTKSSTSNTAVVTIRTV